MHTEYVEARHLAQNRCNGASVMQYNVAISLDMQSKLPYSHKEGGLSGRKRCEPTQRAMKGKWQHPWPGNILNMQTCNCVTS